MIDFQKLRKIYQFSSNVRLSDAMALIKSAKSKSFEAGEYLLKAGSWAKDIYFIRKGIARSFAINQRGDEITTMLRWENQIVTNADAILFEQPSRSYWQVIEPTETFSLDLEVAQDIVSNNPRLEENRKYLLRTLLKEAFTRIDTFVMLSPEERYLDFLESHKEIVNRVPDKYIANILGITPVSLSRIRKRLATKTPT
jgi:CRP-like cAMP-binding protein